MALTVLKIQTGSSIEQAKKHSDTIMSGSMRVLVDTVLSMYDNLFLRTVELMREKALRKQTEEALTLSEKRWKFILEANTEEAWDWDIINNKMLHSESDNVLFEIVANKLCDTKEISSIHPSDRERVKQQIQDHLDGKTEFYVNKYRIIHDSGSWSWVLSCGKVISYDEKGNPSRMVGTSSNITERELASLIYQYSNQAMFVTDINHNIISINPTYTKITGYSEQESLGQPPSFLSSGQYNKPFFNKMWNTLNSSGYWSKEIKNKKKW